ncbi:MAG: hypothetical protein ACO1OQ_08690 [Rufibacter sp.]
MSYLIVIALENMSAGEGRAGYQGRQFFGPNAHLLHSGQSLAVNISYPENKRAVFGEAELILA